MTIRQLPEPCFTLDPSPWDKDQGEPHYETLAEAEAALAEEREDTEGVDIELARLAKVSVKRLDAPCWVAECDAPGGQEGTCPETLGDEEEGPSRIHFETVEELFGWMPGEGWVRVAADGALCGHHAEMGGHPILPPQASAAEQEKAGQLSLPGVLAS